MIEVRHLTKHFGATRAVEDVSFRIARGETIGLLGPNGSGKTTIMRILTGFFPPSSGSALVAGCDATVQSLALRRTIGYLPESVVLYPDMRVRRFLEFCASVRRLPARRTRERVGAVLTDCGLVDVADRLIGTLSKGYRQRVGLAQALLHEPEVLILDEPTVGLDPRQIIEIRELIRGLRGRATVLLSTHILPEVSVTCERVVIIDRGRIVAEDTAEALTRQVEGQDRTLVRVVGPRDAVEQALTGVPGVDRLEVAPPPNGAADTAWSFVAYSAGGANIRQALAQTVVSRGWGLLEIRPLSLSLEDLFVRLVTTEAAAGAAE